MVSIKEAFARIPRENFIPDTQKYLSTIDTPIAIGYGQTNSQPSTVATMLQWLDVHPGQHVMDIGSGSGWTSALLATLCSPGGKVYAVELLPQLVTMGKRNCRRLHIKNVSFHRARHEIGLSKFAPYDRILVSASAPRLPRELLRQLQVSGKLVIPVMTDILEITKTSTTRHTTVVHPGFLFVPLLPSP
jgi:protein-L-isoaspartate(D-aspartate) O-methyltransferase